MPDDNPITNFEDIPETKYSNIEIEGAWSSTATRLIINEVVGIGHFVKTRRIQQYTTNDGSVNGVVLGREDGKVLVASSIYRSLKNGEYFADPSDIIKLEEVDILKLSVTPKTLEEILPYDPRTDNQKDLNSEEITPELRHTNSK